MNIRFYNAQILPMNGNMDIIHGEVWVEGNTITYVGPHKECGNVWDREIDAKKISSCRALKMHIRTQP